MQLGILLVIISIILYFLNLYLFQNVSNTGYYFSIDMAFLPIEVLFVVLVIESVITNREKQILLEKLNMVIGTFFSELGTELLKKFTKFDEDTEKIRKNLLINGEWTEKDFLSAANTIKNFDYSLVINGHPPSVDFLIELKDFFKEKRKFLLVLMENPNLLEHETFTELLRAVFHLAEELENREDLTILAHNDYLHLKGDSERVYGILIYEWLHYMEHLMNNYPYLFSLALRMNPFDPYAKVEIDD